jgi:hypothetical protein
MTIYPHDECHYAVVFYAECLKKVHYAECHYAECRYAEFHYAECCGTLLRLDCKMIVISYSPDINVMKLFFFVTHGWAKKKVFVPGRPFQSGLIFAHKDRSLPYTWVGSGLTN